MTPSGAWRLPGENKLALMFVNVGDEPVSAQFHFHGRQYGIDDQQVSVTTINQEETHETFVAANAFCRELKFPPRTAYAWEVTPL